MKLNKSKTTAISVAALAALCGFSFFAVRSLNNSEHSSVAVVTPLSVATTTAPFTTTEKSTDDTLVTQTTAPTSVVDSGSENRLTTFENITQPSTTEPEAPSTTMTTALTNAAMTTTTAPSTLPTTNVSVTHPVSEEEAREVIESAAVFSEGFLGYKFDPKGQYYYTSNDPWQRNFGFNVLYDLGAPFLNFYYDTIRCKFTSEGKDWMIQLWKGQYGLVFLGCEIGVYNKPEGRTPEHYDCASDEDSLYMSMTFYRKGVERFTRNYAKYWWCTGFVPGTLDSFKDRSELSMKCRITMKSEDMLDGFCKALVKNKLEEGTDFEVSGLDVYISWT